MYLLSDLELKLLLFVLLINYLKLSVVICHSRPFIICAVDELMLCGFVPMLCNYNSIAGHVLI